MLRVRKAALMALRIFFIFSACCAICTIIIWVLAPSIINSLDAKIVSGYVKHYGSSYNRAINDLAKNRGEEAREKLERLLEDIDYVKKGDRLDPLKRNILNKLIQQKIMGGQESEALKYFQTLIDFDERDLGVQIKLAEFLRYNVGRKEEAENVVKKLYERFPSVPMVADVYAYLISSDSDLYGVFQSAYKRYGKVEEFAGQRWCVYWHQRKNLTDSTGKTLSLHKKWMILEPGSEAYGYHFMLTLPPSQAKLERFRIDPAPRSNLRIEDWKVTFVKDRQKFSNDYRNTRLKCHDIDLDRKGVLITNGKTDPYFHFVLAQGLKMDQEIEIRFRARILPNLNKNLMKMLKNPFSVQDLGKEVARLGNEGELEFLRAIAPR